MTISFVQRQNLAPDENLYSMNAMQDVVKGVKKSMADMKVIPLNDRGKTRR